MSKFLTIAYTTKGDYYEELSAKLKLSCEQYNIPLHLDKIESLGSWEKNTHYKPIFIKRCLETLQSPNLIYVDVDALYRGYPILFDNIDTDVAFRIENFTWRKNEPLSGTIYLKNTPGVLSFVEDWIRINSETPAERKNPMSWEQFNMKKALDLHPDLKFINLPPEYVFITDHTRRMYPRISPIIEHFQASRKTAR